MVYKQIIAKITPHICSSKSVQQIDLFIHVIYANIVEVFKKR